MHFEEIWIWYSNSTMFGEKFEIYISEMPKNAVN